MAPTVTVHEWMREVGQREQSAVIARRHVAAEVSSDVERICGTLSHDSFFAVPDRTREGNQLGPENLLTDFSRVESYYSGRQGTYVVLASTQLRTFATDWFVFNESMATLRGTGDVDGVPADGKEFLVHSAVLFPTAPDGIRGEICITHVPFADIVAGTVPTPPPPPPGTFIPPGEVANCDQLDRVIAGLRNGDTDAVAAELSAEHILALRVNDEAGDGHVHTARSATDAASALVSLVAAADDIAVLSRQITDWYVFVEYLVRRPDGGLRRLALLHSAEHGALSGTYGYGRDEPFGA